MGIFSRRKDALELGDANNDGSVNKPNKLPDTVLDKLSSKLGGTSKISREEVFVKPKIIDARRISDEVALAQQQRLSKISSEENTPPINVEPEIQKKPEVKYVQKPVVPENYGGFDEKFIEENLSFFSRLGDVFSKHDSDIHGIDSKELITKMREYHDSLKTGHEFFLHENDVEDQYRKKVRELTELEAEWMLRRKEADSAELYLLEKEQQVESKIEELQRLVGSANRFKIFNAKCPQEKAFILKSGQIIHSIQELLYYLPRMSDETFNHHVSEGRNDFSTWIRCVFGSEKLAEHIFLSSSRKELVEKLKSF